MVYFDTLSTFSKENGSPWWPLVLISQVGLHLPACFSCAANPSVIKWTSNLEPALKKPPHEAKCSSNFGWFNLILGGGNSNIVYFHLYLGFHDPIGRAYFSNGVGSTTNWVIILQFHILQHPTYYTYKKNPSPGRCGCEPQLENLPGDAKLTFQNCSAKSGGAVRVIGEGWSQCLEPVGPQKPPKSHTVIPNLVLDFVWGDFFSQNLLKKFGFRNSPGNLPRLPIYEIRSSWDYEGLTNPLCLMLSILKPSNPLYIIYRHFCWCVCVCLVNHNWLSHMATLNI